MPLGGEEEELDKHVKGHVSVSCTDPAVGLPVKDKGLGGGTQLSAQDTKHKVLIQTSKGSLLPATRTCMAELLQQL